MVEDPPYERCTPTDPLAALDAINTAIVGSSSLDDMLRRVLDVVLEVFHADRAWMMYPCDPTVDYVVLREERTKPDWPGAKARGETVAITDRNRYFFELCQKTSDPVRRDPLVNTMDQLNSEAHTKFKAKSMMAMALRPLGDALWLFGIHHCERPYTYDDAQDLFAAIGRRIGDGLTTRLTLEELQSSERRNRALVDHATEAIVILDLDTGTFMEANPAAARLYGVPVEGLIGHYGPAQLSPEFQPDGERSDAKAMRYIMEALEGGFPEFEWVHRNIEGKDVPCHIALARFPDPTRRLVRGSIIDISERKATEAQTADLEARLIQAQKLEAVGQMTGGVAHDFNNLLNVILGNLELLEEVELSTDDLQLIESAITATHRGADLTQKMLSFARRAHLEPAVINLSDVVRDMDNWMSRTLPATIDVRMELEPALWPVEADHASTESAILNLIINARDAMRNGGVLTIETANVMIEDDDAASKIGDVTPGSHVMLAISDTGTGIPDEYLERVFEPFFTTKGTGQGSGLGLSMVHGFMKQSGGTVRVYSEPGVGTTLKLYFRAAKQLPLPRASKEGGDAVQDSSGFRILVAEDQREVRDVLERILKSAGYEVVAAPDGDAAMRLFVEDGDFDILVTDIVMPGRLQGPGLARALRELDPALPVVFMSGYASEASMHGNGLRKEDIRLMKPVSRTRLLEAVRRALRGD